MSVGRRSFLGMLGASPIVAKSAALVTKQNIEKGIAEQAGVRVGTMIPSVPYISPHSDEQRRSGLLDFLLSRRIPKWAEEDLYEQSRTVHVLDPDIASKRSWSFNVKVAEQRARNLKRLRDGYFSLLDRGMKKREFGEKFGVYF